MKFTVKCKLVAYSTIQRSLLNTACRIHNAKATKQQPQKQANKIAGQKAKPWDMCVGF